MHVKEKGTFYFWKRRDRIRRAWAASQGKEEGRISVGSHERKGDLYPFTERRPVSHENLESLPWNI